MRKIFLFVAVFFGVQLLAQAPEGYYTNAEGKTTSGLKTTLSEIISANYKDIGYSGLLDLYRTSDKTSDGLVWDMYSDCGFSFGNTCGSYKNICDCYNREHSIPQSWFSERYPMRSDAFHVYPTDGKVNGERGNLPFGETNASPLGGKALGKKGASTFPGYSGTVFEPVDEYKGDFARTYFYFVTRYEDQMYSFAGASFNTSTQAAAKYPSLSGWAIELFLKWHKKDPVSQKEIDRNNAVFAKQKNRNPFIDHPELVEHIWGDKKGVPWTPNGGGGGESDCEDFNFSATFSSSLEPFTTQSVKGEQQWTWTKYGATMSGYVSESNVNYENEDWLISPALDLEGYKNIQLSFEHTINKGDASKMQSENTVWISNNYKDNVTSATWKQLPIGKYPTGTDWDFVNSGNIGITAENAQKNTRIAFKYLCTAQSSATWEIRNLTVTGDCVPTSVNEVIPHKNYPIFISHKSITVYNLENENVSIYDIYGRNIVNSQNAFGNTTLNVPISGVYIIRIGNQTVKAIVR